MCTSNKGSGRGRGVRESLEGLVQSDLLYTISVKDGCDDDDLA